MLFLQFAGAKVQIFKVRTKKNSYICTKFNSFMKKYTKNIGLILIVIGTLLLTATQFSPFSQSNIILIAGFFCNLLGAYLIIRGIKYDSRY